MPSHRVYQSLQVDRRAPVPCDLNWENNWVWHVINTEFKLDRAGEHELKVIARSPKARLAAVKINSGPHAHFHAGYYHTYQDRTVTFTALVFMDSTEFRNFPTNQHLDDDGPSHITPSIVDSMISQLGIRTVHFSIPLIDSITLPSTILEKFRRIIRQKFGRKADGLRRCVPAALHQPSVLRGLFEAPRSELLGDWRRWEVRVQHPRPGVMPVGRGKQPRLRGRRVLVFASPAVRLRFVLRPVAMWTTPSAVHLCCAQGCVHGKCSPEGFLALTDTGTQTSVCGRHCSWPPLPSRGIAPRPLSRPAPPTA